MAKQAREAMASETLSVVADRGYFKSEEILACHDADITAYVPKPMTSAAKAEGRFNNDAFHPYSRRSFSIFDQMLGHRDYPSSAPAELFSYPLTAMYRLC